MKKPKERKEKKKKDKKKDSKKDVPVRTVKELSELLEKAKTELEETKTQKIEAVTNEEFDAADKLKAKEETLNNTITSLNKEMEEAVARMTKASSSETDD